MIREIYIETQNVNKTGYIFIELKIEFQIYVAQK